MGCCFHMERELPFNDLPSGCQFPKENLTECDGKTYCEFHLPLEDGDGNFIPRENRTETHNKIMQFISGQGTDLTGVIFPADIKLPSVPFRNLCLQSAFFMGNADFQRLQFSENISFKDVTFRQSANFERTEFFEKVDFRNAKFHTSANFEFANFNKEAWFHDANFSIDGSPAYLANFNGATFSENAWFQGATFCGSASFSSVPGTLCNFNSECIFSNATFLFSPKFSTCQFADITRFEGAIFTEAPEFFGSKLHQGTIFPGEENFKDTTRSDAVAAYRCLKQKMSAIHAHHEQQMFYALEQESRFNQPETPPMEKIFSWLYGRTSKYGQSIGWPVGWIFGTIYFYWIAYLSINGSELGKTFGFSIQQLVRPFTVWGKIDDPWTRIFIDSNPGLIFALTTTQSIISLALVTLFLLAVRRRFKLQ